MPPATPAAARESDTRESICLIVEAAARDGNLPLEFFARVIWQESRFQADAVGPMTRSGEHAQGIAQFMPGTASERGLLNPFNPVQALPKSAEFLNELRNQFGNLGLAAAAYNAGPRRVQEWLAGTGGMPEQTRNYVYAITGTSVDAWAKAGSTGKGPPSSPPTSCRDLMALLKRAPWMLFAMLVWLFGGKAKLKAGIAAHQTLDPARLPYRRTRHRRRRWQPPPRAPG